MAGNSLTARGLHGTDILIKHQLHSGTPVAVCVSLLQHSWLTTHPAVTRNMFVM